MDIGVTLRHPSVKMNGEVEKTFAGIIEDVLKDAEAPVGDYVFTVRGIKDITGKKAPKKRLWGFDPTKGNDLVVYARPMGRERSRYSCTLTPPTGVDAQKLSLKLRAVTKNSRVKIPKAAPAPYINGATNGVTNGHAAEPVLPAAAQLVLPTRQPRIQLSTLVALFRKHPEHVKTYLGAIIRLHGDRPFTKLEARRAFTLVFDYPRTQTEKGVGRAVGAMLRFGYFEVAGQRYSLTQLGRAQVVPPEPVHIGPPVVVEVAPSAPGPIEADPMAAITGVRDVHVVGVLLDILAELKAMRAERGVLDKIRELVGGAL